MRQPDFYILGAMKAATTTLAAQLGAQDGIAMSKDKEPDLFVEDCAEETLASFLAAQWPGETRGQLLGEASTSYTKWPDIDGVPARVKAVSPDAKFIYMIRHPIDRARSHAIHLLRKRYKAKLISEIAAREDALWRYGCYATQLDQWLAHFPKDRFLIVASERLKASPEQEFARVLDFLGVEGAWSADLASLHSAAASYRALPFEGAAQRFALVRFLRRHLIPDGLKQSIRELRAIRDVQGFSEEAVLKLLEKTDPDLRRLGEMCGVELSTTTYRDVIQREHLSLA